MAEIIKEMTDLFTQNNIPVFGTTNILSLKDEPFGYKPSDMLASAKSVLCLGIPVPKGIFKCQERSEWMYWRAANVYYRNIDMVLTKAATMIEEKGEIAVPVYG